MAIEFSKKTGEYSTKRFLYMNETLNKNNKKLNPGDSIFIRLDDKYEFFNIDNILVLNAADDYSEIITLEGKKKLALKSLKEWEERLPDKLFCRIHRSTIINITKVNKIEPWFNYSQRVYMEDIEEPLVMSRGYFSKTKELFG